LLGVARQVLLAEGLDEDAKWQRLIDDNLVVRDDQGGNAHVQLGARQLLGNLMLTSSVDQISQAAHTG
jgi:hypothetical protein